MRIFKNPWFERFARKQKISDTALVEAVRWVGMGQIDADLGGGVVKQRIARPGQGKSGGYRTIILFRLNERAFFVYGFSKGDRGNIGGDEEDGFKRLAKYLLDLSENDLDGLLRRGKLSEISANDQEIS